MPAIDIEMVMSVTGYICRKTKSRPPGLVNRCACLLRVFAWLIAASSMSAKEIVINIDGKSGGRTFEGIGALSAGASSRGRQKT